jgi:hypothetical protein
MSRSDEFAALWDERPDRRIEALARLTKLPRDALQWPVVGHYFVEVLDPKQDVALGERRLAIELAPIVPVREVRLELGGWVSSDDTELRVSATKALAKLGVDVAADLVDLLALELQRTERVSLAMHLLLADVADVRDRVAALRDHEVDPTVERLLSAVLGDVDTDEIDESLPSDVVRLGVTLDYVELSPEWPPANENELRRLLGGPPFDIDRRAGASTEQPSPTRDVIQVRGYMSGVVAVGSSVTIPSDHLSPSDVRSSPSPPPSRSSAYEQQRVFEAQAPEVVGETNFADLRVRLALQASPDSQSTPLALPVPEDGLDLRLVVHAPGFAVVEAPRTLHVPAQGDGNWHLVGLRAVRAGVHGVILTLFNQGRQVAELTVEITVETTGTTSGQQTARGLAAGLTGADGEVTLLIDWLETEGHYNFQLFQREDPSENILSRPLKQPPRKIVEQLVADLNRLARNTARDVPNVRQWLRDKGIELWQQMLPEALQFEFWKRRDGISSLKIVAKDDPVPWELLYPLRRGDDAGFLVEQFPVMRGLRGVGKPGPFGAGPVLTVLPEVGNPSSAATEIAMVRQLWATRDGGEPLRDLMSLRQALQRAEFGVLHFACHNRFDADSAGDTQIRFGSHAFTPSALAEAEQVRALKDQAPLVVLNACRSAGQAPAYTELAGWGTRFLRAGAGAFLGSLWEVRDASAKGFMETFYRAALDRQPLGRAVLAARQAIEADDDPTWLAYAAYGDPQATVVGVET